MPSHPCPRRGENSLFPSRSTLTGKCFAPYPSHAANLSSMGPRPRKHRWRPRSERTHLHQGDHHQITLIRQTASNLSCFQHNSHAWEWQCCSRTSHHLMSSRTTQNAASGNDIAYAVVASLPPSNLSTLASNSPNPLASHCPFTSSHQTKSIVMCWFTRQSRCMVICIFSISLFGTTMPHQKSSSLG